MEKDTGHDLQSGMPSPHEMRIGANWSIKFVNSNGCMVPRISTV